MRMLAWWRSHSLRISLTAGFSSQSHLSSWFRRLVGVSPAAYRRQI